MAEHVKEVRQQNNEQLSSPGKLNILDSIISIFIKNAGDLSDDYSQHFSSKKTFIRLFTHLRSSNNNSFCPLNGRNFVVPHACLFKGPDQIAYYIFALEKIVI